MKTSNNKEKCLEDFPDILTDASEFIENHEEMLSQWYMSSDMTCWNLQLHNKFVIRLYRVNGVDYESLWYMVISWKQHFLSQIATFVEKDMWYVNRPIYEEKKTMVNGQQTKSRKNLHAEYVHIS